MARVHVLSTVSLLIGLFCNMQRLRFRFGQVSGFIKKLCESIFGIFNVFFELCNTVFIWCANKVHLFAVDAGEETGILAISLMASRSLHPIERCLWLVVVCAAIYGVTNLSDLQLKRYFTSPTVVSVDRDYRGWNGSLPAITLCYYDHIDSYKANEYITDHWNISIIDEDYFYFMDFLYSVVNASASNYADLARFAEDERFDDVDLYDLVRAIDRPFEQVLTSFDANFEVQVRPVMTERGSCYAINSPMSEILTGGTVEFSELRPPLTCQFGKQQCYIKMDLYESTGTIDVHSPFEVSATDASVIALHKSDEIIASYKVLETVASKNLRELSVEQRKCVFHDEETSQLKIYSKTLCLARCRAIMALEMCNCVPFFYPFVDGPSCNPAGFECLLDFKWPIWALHICKCPSTCTEISYTVQTVKKSSWGVKSNEEDIKTDVATSSFRWDLIPPKVRMRRDVVFSFEDLLVSFGGALALFLGFSILSITQLAFVLTFHILQWMHELLVYMCYNFKKYVHYFRNYKQRDQPQMNTRFIKPFNKKPPNFQQNLLTDVHQQISENEISAENVNNMNDTLDKAFGKPKFEYLQ